MRIIGGELKSRLIQFPKTKKTRPMMDRMKETIFNVLGDSVQKVSVLDLFAGSGSLGIEALSRGAKNVIFIDQEEIPCAVIRKNLESLRIPKSRSQVRQIAVMQAIRNLSKQKVKFGLIFVDPPFNKGFVKKILRELGRFDIVDRFGKVVVQRSQHEELPADLKQLRLIQEKEIGQAFVDFLVPTEPGSKTPENNQEKNG